MLSIPTSGQVSELIKDRSAQAALAKRNGYTGPYLYEAWEFDVNKAVRRFLYAQQAGRCAYCERRITLNPMATKIEHFHPQSRPDHGSACLKRTGLTEPRWRSYQIHLGNLLLCCTGDRMPEGATCDTLKGNTHICEVFFNPKGATKPTLVTVGPDGRVHAASFPAGEADAQDVIDHILRLNADSLVRTRRDLISARQQKFVKAKNASKEPAAQFRARAANDLRREALTAEFGSTLLSLADSLS
jgi:uncharacterized protein (TIGR02646 family)